MEAALLREKLHEYINTADEQHLSAIYVLIENNIPVSGHEKYDEATLKMFYERRENHLEGISKSYTVEESMNLVREQYKKNNGL